MSRSSYTASERRGVLAIAIIAIVTIAAGIGYAFFESHNQHKEEAPVIVEHPEMIDSTRLQLREEKKSSKSKKGKKAKKSSSKNNEKKQIRRRSPLDEPV